MKTVMLVTGLLLSFTLQAQKNRQERTESTYDTTMRVTNRKPVKMDPTKDIVQNINNSHLFYSFMTAIRGVGLVQTLQGPGPFTVFAPTDSAFQGASQIHPLMEDDNHGQELKKIISLHIVPGKWTVQSLQEALKKGNGQVALVTLNGDKIMVVQKGKQLAIQDRKGTLAYLNPTDQLQKNGVIHMVNSILRP